MFPPPCGPACLDPCGIYWEGEWGPEGSPDCCPRGCGTTGFAAKTDSRGEQGVRAEVPMVFLCPGRGADVTPVLMLLPPEA